MGILSELPSACLCVGWPSEIGSRTAVGLGQRSDTYNIHLKSDLILSNSWLIVRWMTWRFKGFSFSHSYTDGRVTGWELVLRIHTHYNAWHEPKSLGLNLKPLPHGSSPSCRTVWVVELVIWYFPSCFVVKGRYSGRVKCVRKSHDGYLKRYYFWYYINNIVLLFFVTFSETSKDIPLISIPLCILLLGAFVAYQFP